MTVISASNRNCGATGKMVWREKRKLICFFNYPSLFFIFPHLKHTAEPLFFGACVILFISVGMVFKSLSFYCIHTHMKMCVSVCVWWYFCVLHHPSATRRSDGHFESMKGSVCQNSYVCLSVSVACDSSRFLYPHNTNPNIFVSPSIACQVSLFPVVKSKSIRYMKEPFSTTRWHILSLQSNVFSALI